MLLMALSISLASALTSFFISFLARSVASSIARSIVISPTTIKAASLSSRDCLCVRYFRGSGQLSRQGMGI